MGRLVSNCAAQTRYLLTATLLSAHLLVETLAAWSMSHYDAACFNNESKDDQKTSPSFRSLLQARSRPMAADLHQEDLAARILENVSTSNAHSGVSRSATRMFPVVWIVVAENMNGFLQATLACNRALVDKIVVVTSPTDQETINVCQSAGLICHMTEALHAQGDAFNKGRALSEVQQSLHKNPKLAGWMALLMDVDICLPPEIWMDMNDLPDANSLYSVYHRCIYDTPASVALGSPTSVEATPGDSLGYFQMYMISPGSPTYSKDYPTASDSDTDFFQRFLHVVYLPSYVHHFGNLGAYTGNWDGVDTSSAPWSSIALPQQHCCPTCR